MGKVQHQVRKDLLHLSRARCATREVIIWCRVMPGCVPAVKVAGVCELVEEVGCRVLSVVASAQSGDDSGGFIKSITYGGSEDIMLECQWNQGSEG